MREAVALGCLESAALPARDPPVVGCPAGHRLEECERANGAVGTAVIPSAGGHLTDEHGGPRRDFLDRGVRRIDEAPVVMGREEPTVLRLRLQPRALVRLV